jgi:hypothetical protein
MVASDGQKNEHGFGINQNEQGYQLGSPQTPSKDSIKILVEELNEVSLLDSPGRSLTPRMMVRAASLKALSDTLKNGSPHREADILREQIAHDLATTTLEVIVLTGTPMWTE